MHFKHHFFFEMWKMPGSGPPPNVEFSTFFFDGFPYHHDIEPNISHTVSSPPDLHAAPAAGAADAPRPELRVLAVLGVPRLHAARHSAVSIAALSNTHLHRVLLHRLQLHDQLGHVQPRSGAPLEITTSVTCLLIDCDRQWRDGDGDFANNSFMSSPRGWDGQ